MLISKKWLSQYMDVSDLSIEEIAERITNAGLEVEGIEKGAQATNLVIGHIESCVDHPDSDHLHVCQVNVGTDTRQIVCGASFSSTRIWIAVVCVRSRCSTSM